MFSYCIFYDSVWCVLNVVGSNPITIAFHFFYHDFSHVVVKEVVLCERSVVCKEYVSVPIH